MKTYLVFQHKIGFRGFTPSKKMIRTFRLQRDMDIYTIYKVDDEDDLRNYGITELSDDDEMFWCHSSVVFRDEEEVFSLSVDQYVKDFRGYASHVLYYSQFIKLEKYEKECLYKFGRIIHDLLQFLESDEYPEELYEEIFDITKMIEAIT